MWSRLRESESGFSLVEAIIASFLLLTSIAISVHLFDDSLQAEASSEQRIVAALVAESALAEVRREASRDFSGLASRYDGQTWSLPDYPNFQIRTSLTLAELAVPCTELETQYSRSAAFPEPQGRYLSSSAAKVDVEVTWEDGGSQSVVITELVANSSRAGDFRLELLLDDGSVANDTTVVNVAKGALADFSVRAVAGGQEVGDIQFGWHVKPLTGFGSIHRVSRDGQFCQYRNAFRNFDDTLKYAPGASLVVVRARYQGREATAEVRVSNAS